MYTLDYLFLRTFLEHVIVDTKLQGYCAFSRIFSTFQRADPKQIGILNFQVARRYLEFLVPKSLGIVGKGIAPPIIHLEDLAITTKAT